MAAMSDSASWFLGEWARTLDERFRFSLPAEWVEPLTDDQGECVLAKEQPGCVSLWHPAAWEKWLQEGVALVTSKVQSGRVADRIDQVQMFGRLLSTRHRKVPIAGKARLAIPDSFRTFLEVEPGGELLVVGAAVCVELWQPSRWSQHIGEHMPEFRSLFDRLAN
jgi:MraZ protein